MKNKTLRYLCLAVLTVLFLAANVPLAKAIEQSVTQNSLSTYVEEDPETVDCWNSFARNGSMSQVICSFMLLEQEFTCKVITDLTWVDGLSTCEWIPPPPPAP